MKRIIIKKFIRRKQEREKKLLEAAKQTARFFSRGNIFLQIGKFKTSEDLSEELREHVVFDFSSL